MQVTKVAKILITLDEKIHDKLRIKCIELRKEQRELLPIIIEKGLRDL